MCIFLTSLSCLPPLILSLNIEKTVRSTRAFTEEKGRIATGNKNSIGNCICEYKTIRFWIKEDIIMKNRVSS